MMSGCATVPQQPTCSANQILGLCPKCKRHLCFSNPWESKQICFICGYTGTLEEYVSALNIEKNRLALEQQRRNDEQTITGGVCVKCGRVFNFSKAQFIDYQGRITCPYCGEPQDAAMAANRFQYDSEIARQKAQAQRPIIIQQTAPQQPAVGTLEWFEQRRKKETHCRTNCYGGSCSTDCTHD